jgi:hypothetical protein
VDEQAYTGTEAAVSFLSQGAAVEITVGEASVTRGRPQPVTEEFDGLVDSEPLAEGDPEGKAGEGQSSVEESEQNGAVVIESVSKMSEPNIEVPSPGSSEMGQSVILSEGSEYGIGEKVVQQGGTGEEYQPDAFRKVCEEDAAMDEEENIVTADRMESQEIGDIGVMEVTSEGVQEQVEVEELDVNAEEKTHARIRVETLVQEQEGGPVDSLSRTDKVDELQKSVLMAEPYEEVAVGTRMARRGEIIQLSQTAAGDSDSWIVESMEAPTDQNNIEMKERSVRSPVPVDSAHLEAKEIVALKGKDMLLEHSVDDGDSEAKEEYRLTETQFAIKATKQIWAEENVVVASEQPAFHVLESTVKEHDTAERVCGSVGNMGEVLETEPQVVAVEVKKQISVQMKPIVPVGIKREVIVAPPKMFECTLRTGTSEEEEPETLETAEVGTPLKEMQQDGVPHTVPDEAKRWPVTTTAEQLEECAVLPGEFTVTEQGMSQSESKELRMKIDAADKSDEAPLTDEPLASCEEKGAQLLEQGTTIVRIETSESECKELYEQTVEEFPAEETMKAVPEQKDATSGCGSVLEAVYVRKQVADSVLLEADRAVRESETFTGRTPSNVVSTGIARESQSPSDSLQASGSPSDPLVRASDDGKELMSEPELRGIVESHSHFIEQMSGDVGGADIEDNAEERAFGKPTASSADDTQSFLLRSETCDAMGHGSSGPRQQQRLHIEARVTETEVKELMCEVREVTRQIKQEVRELKPDLTPTPDGTDPSILPLSESREFVEPADLGCIKEEQPVLSFDEKRSQSALLSYATPDTCLDTTSTDEKLYQALKVHYGSFPPSEVLEFDPKCDTEKSDILTSFSDVGIMQSPSPATPECLLPGGNIMSIEDTITEPSAEATPGQHRTSEGAPEECICEEQIGARVDTSVHLTQITSGAAGVCKEMLDKPSVSRVGTLTRGALGLDCIPSVASRAEMLDKPSESVADLREYEFEPVFAIHSPRRRIKDDSYSKKPSDVAPEEDVDSLPNETPNKLPVSGLGIHIPDEHCLSEHTVDKMPTKETTDKLKFVESSVIVQGERIDLMQEMKLKLEAPHCGTAADESVLLTDARDSHDSVAVRRSEECTDVPEGESQGGYAVSGRADTGPVAECSEFVTDVPEGESQGGYADTGPVAECSEFVTADVPEGESQGGYAVSGRADTGPVAEYSEFLTADVPEGESQGGYGDTGPVAECSEFVTADVPEGESQGGYGDTGPVAECSEFVTADETALTSAAVADAGKLLIQESRSDGFESFVHLSRDPSAEETRSSALTEAESSDNDLSTETRLQEAEPDSSIALQDVTCHASPEDRQFMARAEPVCAAGDVPVVSPDVFVSQMKSRVLSQEQALDMASENVTGFPPESSVWRIEPGNVFGISADDIVMKDDLLEVTVSDVRDGKFLGAKSGATRVEYETGVTRPVSVVSSQPVTTRGPGHRGEKFTEDASHDESKTRKESVKTKPKKELCERQAQKELSTTKKAGDHLIVMHRKEHVVEASTSATASRYRGYMASTLSRDLKVERSVSERSSYFKRETSTKRSINTESEESSNSASPSKPPLPKHTSTGSVQRTAESVTKSSGVDSISAAPEKHAEEAVAEKHAGISKRIKPTTSAVTTSSAAKLVPSAGNITVQKRVSASAQPRLKPSEDAASQDRGRKRKRGLQALNGMKEQRKRTTDSGDEQTPKPICGDSLKRTASEQESAIGLDDAVDSKAIECSAEATKTDVAVAEPVPSSTQFPASDESGVTICRPQADSKDGAIAPAAPAPEPSPSIKSILDKSSAVASQRKSRSPSASPVRAATSASRTTDRFDCSSHTPPSLPSSPSRMLRHMTSQVGVTQLLTSEVFTRTVDASGSIEVIYRQPTSSEALRRVATVPGARPAVHETAPGVCNAGAEGDVSLIDTTDSSLSDSVALPSSSSDHDLSVDARLRTGGSPASPKPTRRSFDLIHDGLGPKLRTADMLFDYCPVPSAAGTEHLAAVGPRTRACPHVSEERLSPILDVRAVTPPRVKHKFQYEDDNEDGEEEQEETVAVFHGSAGKTNGLLSTQVPLLHSFRAWLQS